MHAYIYVCNNSLLYLKAKYISIIKPSGLNKFSKKKKSSHEMHDTCEGTRIICFLGRCIEYWTVS